MAQIINFDLDNEILFQELLNIGDYISSVLLIKIYPSLHWYTHINNYIPPWAINNYYNYGNQNINPGANLDWLRKFVEINYKNVDKLEFNNLFDENLIVDALASHIDVKHWYLIINSEERANRTISTLLEYVTDPLLIMSTILPLKRYELTIEQLIKLIENGIPTIELLIKHQEYRQAIYRCYGEIFKRLIVNNNLFNEFKYIHDNMFVVFDKKVSIISKIIEPTKMFLTEDQRTFWLIKAIEHDNLPIIKLFEQFLTKELKESICEWGHMDLIIEYKVDLLTRESICCLVGKGHMNAAILLMKQLTNRNNVYYNADNEIVTKADLLLITIHTSNVTAKTQMINYLNYRLEESITLSLLNNHSFDTISLLAENNSLPEMSLLWQRINNSEVMNYLLDKGMYPTHSVIHKKMDDSPVWIRCFGLGLCNKCCMSFAAIQTDELYYILADTFGIYRQNELYRAIKKKPYGTICVDTFIEMDSTYFLENLYLVKCHETLDLMNVIKSLYREPYEYFYIQLLITTSVKLPFQPQVVFDSDEITNIKRKIFHMEEILRDPRYIKKVIESIKDCRLPNTITSWKYICTFDVDLLERLFNMGCIDLEWAIRQATIDDSWALFNRIRKTNPNLVTGTILDLALQHKSKYVLRDIMRTVSTKTITETTETLETTQ